MNTEQLDNLRYPIGKFNAPLTIKKEHLDEWITDISEFPSKLTEALKDLPLASQSWRYRPDGWNITQLVHHCSDSHMNSIIRFKWTLTEDHPTIKPYEETLWAELPDANEADLTNALNLLISLHHKWTIILKNLSDEDLVRTFLHPASGNTATLKKTIGMYAWHCRHHLAHVKLAIEAQGKY